jgi:hypothetical protein
MTVLTAMELAGNYPENTKIESQKATDGKFCSFLYMLRDGSIHKLMLSTKAVFETAKDAEDALHELGQWAVKEYGS